MSTKAKTQVTVTPAPPATLGPVGGQSLFDSPDGQTEIEDTLNYAENQVATGVGDPPESQLQRAEQQGHHFEQIEISAYQPATTGRRLMQRQPMESFKERWEDGAVSLKPQTPLAAEISPGEEKWEDGAVTLKTESGSVNSQANTLIQTEKSGGAFTAGSQIESQLRNSKGGGQPLPENTRDFMESRFGNDFGAVRVHNNAEAVQMNQALKAQAFTHGNDIYFNSGKYKPESTGGKRLLAHELTHTIQQTGPSAVSPKRLAQKAEKVNKSSAKAPLAVDDAVAPKIQRQGISQVRSRPVGDLEEVTLTAQPQLIVGTVGDPYEQEANQIADQVVQGGGLDSVLQRDKKDDIKEDVNDAMQGINQEINSHKKGEADTSEADKGAEAGRKLADEAKSKLVNADDEEAAEEAAGKLKIKGEDESKKVQDKGAQTQQEETQKQIADTAKAEQAALAEQEKQAQETAEAQQTEAEETEPPAEKADGSAAAGEDTETLESEATPEHLPDPGAITAPEMDQDKAPTSPDDDPAFAAAVSQSEQVAAQQSLHKPAAAKAQEAQEAANDPAQQTRRAQAAQSNEAGDKEPQLFDREAFVRALLAVLETNKPKSQKDVEQGKGMDGASEKMTAEIDKAKQGAGGGLQESATRAPDPAVEDPKEAIPTPEAVAETGEKPADELIDPAAATPKPKTEAEIEQPLQETGQAIADLIPQDRKDLPPIQTKLMVGAPGDQYEQEADRMADAVIAMPDPKILTVLPKDTPHSPAQPISPKETAAAAQPAIQSHEAAPEDDPDTEAIQRQPELTQLPDIQLLPGLFLQRQAVLKAETPTQEGNAVPLDEHRLKLYEKEAGVDASGALEAGQQHFGGQAQAKFRQTESTELTDTQRGQSDSIAASNQDMFSTRLENFTNIHATQQETQTQDEGERSRVSQAIQAIYDQTKGNVNSVLGRMDARVNAEFAATDRRAKAVFERRQKQLFAQWKHDYYRVRNPLLIPWIEVKTGWAYVRVRFFLKPFFNTPLWLVNKIFTGLPDEVNQIYEIAKEDYLAVQREGVHRIADIVEAEMNQAKAEVDRGRQRVQEYVAALPEDLKSVGAEAAANIQAQFDGLEQTIRDKQNALVENLKAKYEASLKAVNQRIEALKAANASLVSKIAKAIGDIAKWILRQILRILEPPISLIPGIGSKVGEFLDAFVDDPGGIMQTLFKGLGEGFKNFGKNIQKHIINGFFEWLLGSGIQIKFPDKFDLQGIIDILLQILGISKDAIFDLAASLLPGWAVELLQMLMEQGIGALSSMMDSLTELGVPNYVIGFFKAIAQFPQKGVLALWDFIKTLFSSLKGEFITTIITQLVIPEIVIAGIQWLVGLLNPAAGIAKIAKAIIDVIIFLIDNRSLIFEVLASIGATFSALISKSWSPVATAVEIALANIIPLALGLFISLLGLGGIPKKIGKVVEKLRTPVDKGLAKVFGKIGLLLDPVGAIEEGASGLRDKAASKKNKKKKGGPDEGDRDDPKPTQKPTGQTPSTKNKSQPPDASSPQKPKKGSQAGAQNTPPSKTGKRPDQPSGGQQKTQDKDQRGRDDHPDDAKKRLLSAMQAVDRIAEARRDPNAVKRELPALKQKYDLDAIKLTKRGQEKYRVTGKAKAKTTSGKKHSKVRRKPLPGGLSVPAIQAQRKGNQGNWTDENNQVTVKKRLKASKTKGGSFTVKVKLMEKAAVLKQVEKTLKRHIKLNARIDVVEKQVARLKAQYKLKMLKIVKLMPDGSRYQILAEVKPGKTAQRQAAVGARPNLMAHPGLEAEIQRAENRGQAISPTVRAPLERAFGVDFSPVRIHTDREGDRLSRSLEAKAFTTGRDIFFRHGAYAPETPKGQHLLTHELTHVVQQSGDRPVLMAPRTPRQGADPPPTQRSPQSPGLGLWLQRDPEEGAAGGAAVGAIAGGVASAAAGAAFNAGAGLAADAAVDMAASQLMPGASIKSRITDNNSKLTMNVKVKDRDIDLGGEQPTFEADEEPGGEGLPASIVNDIVRVIQDIVNQNPDPDVVARKLDKVRVMFEMKLVKLVSYSEVGSAFEYIIKINGRAQFLRASKIASFLKRLGGAKRKRTASMSADPAPHTPSQDSELPSPELVSAEPPVPGPESTTAQPAARPAARPAPPSPSRESEAGTPSTVARPSNSSPVTNPETVTTDSSRTSDTEASSKKVKPSSTTPNNQSKAKLEQAQDREINVKSQVRRLDPETVDVIIRAVPQSQTR